MEVKINKDIREFTENIFLDCRCDSSFFYIGMYSGSDFIFLAQTIFGIETLSWTCILGAVPLQC